jgi:tetratricopeptide (TPR) repeat protein
MASDEESPIPPSVTPRSNVTSPSDIAAQSGAGVVSAAAATWFGNLDQASFDTAFYERILLRQPNDVRVLKLLGELYARQGRHDLSLPIDQKLVELYPHDSLLRYNLACSLAMQNATGQALEALASALDLGYNDFSHLEVDPDFNRLRPLPEFQALLQKFVAG